MRDFRELAHMIMESAKSRMQNEQAGDPGKRSSHNLSLNVICWQDSLFLRHLSLFHLKIFN